MIRDVKLTQTRTATKGSPEDVHFARNLGACRLTARPYRIREALKRVLFAAENALVRTAALITDGSAARHVSKTHDELRNYIRCLLRIPARLKARTNGDWPAVDAFLYQAIRIM